MASNEERDRLMPWEERWKDRRIAFHQLVVHPALINGLDKITQGKTGLKFFVPLCGKTLDMKWLIDQGHFVVGVEAVETAILEFFQEQNIKFSVTDVEGIQGGKIYQSDDGKLKIYQCDLFSLNRGILGQFDAVWDRGSLVALDVQDRDAYANLLRGVMAPGSKLFVEVFEYDWEKRIVKGPPRPVFLPELKRLYGEWCLIEQDGEKEELIEKRPRYKQWGLDSVILVHYLLTPK